MQDGIGVGMVLLQQFDGLLRRHDEQFNLATLGFDLHLLHHRQGTVAGADYQATALPRYPSSNDSGVCPKASRNFLGRFLLPLTSPPRSITTVVVVADLIDPNGAIGESVKSHNVRPTRISASHYSGGAVRQI